MRKALSLIVILSFSTSISAQTIKLNQLTINDGLSSGNVNCILQDSRGFMWFGTDNGLNRYDGYEFTIYKSNPQISNSIGGNLIRCLFEDSQSNLWIGLKGDGLSKMDLKTGEIKSYRHRLDKRNVRNYDVAGIVEDQKGNIWVAVDRGGLDLYIPEIDDFKHFDIVGNINREELNNAFTDIKIDNNGMIWLSSWGGGIYVFDTEKRLFTVHPHWSASVSENEICKHIYSIYLDNNNKLWVASGHGGLYSLDIETDELHSFFDPSSASRIPMKSITAVSKDNEGRIWVSSTDHGIYIINTDGTTNHLSSTIDGENKLLADNNFYLYTDKTGTVWIGTPVGVNFYSPLLYQFSLFRKKDFNQISKSENQVLSILKDSRGNIWTGGVNNLNKIQPNGNYSDININFLRYNSLHEDDAGNIWIGGHPNILVKHNPQTGEFTHIKIPSPSGTEYTYRNVYDIYEDWDRSLWLATELGVVNYNPANGSFKTLFESGQIIYPEDRTRFVFRDKDLELWVGTENGLKRFDRYNKFKNTYLISNPEYSITNNFITSIVEDVNNILWIGTMGGLHRFDKKNEIFELIKRPDKIYGDPILGLIKDERGKLWISSTSEIFQFDTKTKIFNVYIASDGLQDKDFQLRAFYKASDGELFFGGKNGFNSFYPSKLVKNTNIPKVVITDFLIFNRSVTTSDDFLEYTISETKEIKIKSGQSVITFKFSALNFLSPEKNKYAYKLEGFDADWTYVDADMRQATYTNLNPGEYTFKVMASNNDGVWNEIPTELKLRITPPFWRSWFAYSLYLLLFVGIIFYLIQWAIDRNKLKLARIEAERVKEIDQMKMDLFTNVSHEFRTPLSLILGPITQIIENKRYSEEDKELNVLIYRNAQRLLRLINQLLDFRKIETGKLDIYFKYDNIGNFINGISHTFAFMAKEKNIQYEVDVKHADFWMKFDSDKIDKILYNLISNAFHYTPDGGSIKVLAKKIEKHSKEFLQIKVIDTGIGIAEEEKNNLFKPFYQGQRQKKLRNAGSGLGLALTKELIDLLKGSIHVESKVNKGTTFTINIPVPAVDNKSEKLIPESVVLDTDLNGLGAETDETLDNSDIILVVEDDPDMQFYINNILSDKFKVIIANNGEDGYNKAVENIPDMIISDIMMPVMDGMEMVNKLKGDNKTSHIPLILLTSLHNESYIVKGYEVGVDDYITKPFSSTILKSRIDNILALRKRNWEQYHQSENLEEYTDKLSENPRKKEFLSEVNKIIHSQIDNPDFGINELAMELNMSVNQLFRKVRNILNTTPYNLIIQVRMTHAAKLIRESDYNISEITFLVGYQELSNFSRSFKKFHNMSPRDYQSKFA